MGWRSPLAKIRRPFRGGGSGEWFHYEFFVLDTETGCTVPALSAENAKHIARNKAVRPGLLGGRKRYVPVRRRVYVSEWERI